MHTIFPDVLPRITSFNELFAKLWNQIQARDKKDCDKRLSSFRNFNLFKKIGHSRSIFVHSIQLTVNVHFKFWPMTGFELGTSGIRSDSSASWASKTSIFCVARFPLSFLDEKTFYVMQLFDQRPTEALQDPITLILH